MQDTLQKEKKKPRYDFAVWLLFWEKGVFLFEEKGCVHLGAK